MGKPDNGQVAVVGGLSQGSYYCPVVAELFMPKSWENDQERRKKVGVPDYVVHRTKPIIAFEMILEQRKKGTKFDFVGFDALYGSSMTMVDSLEDSCIPLIGDIKENMHVFLENPSYGIPIPESGKKRRKSKYPKTDSTSIAVQDYIAIFKDRDWNELAFTTGVKKPIKALFHKR